MSAFPQNSSQLPSINQDFIDLSGCNVIDLLPLDPKAKEIITKAQDGTLFQNPVADLISEGFGKINEFRGAVGNAVGDAAERFMSVGGDAEGDLLGGSGLAKVLKRPNPAFPGVGLPNPFDIPQFIPETVSQYVGRISNDIQSGVAYFQQQAEMTSGISLVPPDQRPAGSSDTVYNSDGGLEGFPGILGLQNVANGFNQTKNSLENPDEVLDRYSEFFGSVAGPGTEVFSTFTDAMGGDVGGAFAAFATNDSGQITAFDDTALTDMVNAYDSAKGAIGAVESFVNNERAIATAATDYLSKTVFGFSVLAMLADPCFGQKLAKKIFDI